MLKSWGQEGFWSIEVSTTQVETIEVRKCPTLVLNEKKKIKVTWYAERGFHMLSCLKISPDWSFMENLQDKLTVGLRKRTIYGKTKSHRPV